MTQAPARILIADDEEIVRLSTAALLRQKGYVCDCAQNAEEAARLLQDSYDLLIADIRMPGNCEMELLRSLHERMPELPVVVLTGYPTLPTAIESLRLSICDYLIKPFEMSDLQQAIERGLQKGRLLQSVRKASVETTQLTAAFKQLEEMVMMSGGSTRPPLVTWAVKRYAEQAVLHIAQLSLVLVNVLNGLEETEGPSADVCQIMRCQRLAAYEQVLEDSVEVLERTKHAFKSKELGELRKQLETILKMNRGLG